MSTGWFFDPVGGLSRAIWGWRHRDVARRPAHRALYDMPVYRSCTCNGTLRLMKVSLSLAATILCTVLVFGQNPEYEFYAGYRDFMSALWMKNPSITATQVHEAYAAKLREDGVAETEIQRRLRLLATKGPQLEADRWDRFYGDAKHNGEYNQSPNAFLMAFIADKRPGTALDYAMGTGRNALYLAKLGWDVYGFDQSRVAVAAAQ